MFSNPWIRPNRRTTIESRPMYRVIAVLKLQSGDETVEQLTWAEDDVELVEEFAAEWLCGRPDDILMVVEDE